MPVITKISVQQKQTDRYNIEVDGNYAFSVDESVLIEFHLKKGREISKAETEEIQIRDGVRKGLNTAIQYLSIRMRSEKEVLDYLKKKEVDEASRQEILTRLREMSYLNDEQFADAFIKTQIQTTEKGPFIIFRELKEKGIDEEIASTLLEQFSEEQQMEKAAALFEKQLKKHKRDSAFLRQKKAEEYVMNKGYSSSILKKAAVLEPPDAEEELNALMHQAEKAHRRYKSYEKGEYRQKMKMALYRKGFDLSEIDKAIEKLQEE
ncbi:recombination regulator RecX [Domibacillus epiphyticus]|uniref:Regulatory protein RecX n=1 Tax=Domibacillus epiphyticus TaxID=1714355 RepID=A0A1V2AAX3_9BACI|nr:recombination regulator RecX [Domibacillus epiphyticus]OMP68146.1 recombination regulator RecX [Domibacillus epiphyticus]